MNKKNLYTVNNFKLFKQSFWIWVFVVFQLLMNVLMIVFLPTNHLFTFLLVVNVILSPISIMGLVIHFNYLKQVKNCRLIIKYDSINFTNHFVQVSLKNSDIVKIKLYGCTSSLNFSLWANLEWFELYDKEGNSIRINSYLMTLDQFWQDSLTKKITVDSIDRKNMFYPLMK